MSMRTPKLYGEVVSFLQNSLKGFAAGSGKETEARYFEEFGRILDVLLRGDRKQESLKVQLKNATQEIERELETARAKIARAICYLEWTYGKQSDELKKYGLSPRQFGRGPPARPPRLVGRDGRGRKSGGAPASPSDKVA